MNQSSFHKMTLRVTRGPQPSNTAILDQKSLFKGWLTKQGGMVKSWQKRWFELKGDQLLYFKEDKRNKDTEEPSFMWTGSIPLPGMKVEEKPYNPDEPGKYFFEIVPGEGQTRVSSSHETYPMYADTDQERQAWIQVIRRIIYGPKGGGIFGQSLDDTMKFDMRKNFKVPQIVHQCIQFLRSNGMEAEGIFRLPGRAILIKKLKRLFDCGEMVDFDQEEADIHTIASLLKLYLRELPDSLINRDNYLHMASIASKFQCGAIQDAIDKTIELLKYLPPSNYNLLKYICQFFSDVSKLADVNKMTVTNLSTVLGPNIARPEDDNNPMNLMGTTSLTQQIAFFLIERYDDLFKMEYSPDGKLIETDDIIQIEEDDSFRSPMTHKPSVRATSYINATRRNTDLLDSDDFNDTTLPLIDPMITPPMQRLPVRPTKTPRTSINSKRDDDIPENYALPPVTETNGDQNHEHRENSKVTPSQEQLQIQVEALKQELVNQRTIYEAKIKALKSKHHLRINDFAAEINIQKEATEQSVTRVMNLQSQLQKYQLKYGLLE